MLINTQVLTSLELKSAIVRDPLIVKPDTTVMEAIGQMSRVRAICDSTKTVDGQLEELYIEARSSCVLVVEDQQLLGIFTERDVVRLSAQKCSLENLAMQEVMISPVISLQESALTDLFSTINLLQQHHIRHVPILDDQNQVVGIVTNESLRQTSRPVDLLRLRLVSEVMTREVISTAPDTSMLAIAQLMADHRVSSVMIVQTQNSLVKPLQIPVGIITERDIVQFQALGLNLEAYLADAVMSTPVFAVKSDDSLLLVQQIMEQHLIRRLAVTGEQGELLGIVTQTSLLQALNPLELYRITEVLSQKVEQLEADKIALLENRTVELEKEVAARTIALRTQAEREKLVAELATQIRSSLSLQTILDTTVEKIRQLLGCDRVNIWQFDADWQTLAVAESTNSSLSLLGRQIKDTCLEQKCAEIFSQGRIIVVSDIYKTEISECYRQMLIDIETRSKILAPIFCDDKLWGLLNATESKYAREWKSEEVELLQALSVHLAIAIQQATTHQKLQEQLLEKQQAETALIQSEAQNRAILEAIPDFMFRMGADGVYRGFVTADREINMLTKGFDPTGSSMVDVLPLEIANRHLYYLGQALSTGKLQVYEQQTPIGNRLQDEEVRVIKSSEDEALFMIRDISEQQAALRERQRAEEELFQLNQELEAKVAQRTAEAQMREAQLRDLFDNATDMIQSIAPDGRILFVNRAWKETLGYVDADLENLSIFQVIHPEDLNYCQTIMANLFAGSNCQGIETKFVTKDGRVIIVEGNVNCQFKDGVPISTRGIFRDITQRKMLQEKLVYSESKMRSIFESITDIILTISLQGQEIQSIDIPPVSSSFTNSHYTEIVDQTINNFLQYSSDNDWRQRVSEILASGQANQFDYALSVGTELLWFSTVISPINATTVTWVARDISDRKRAEAELQKLSERLAVSLKSGAIGCWEWDIVQNTILWDERMYELYGVTKANNDSLVYDIWAKGLHPDDRTTTENLLQQAVLGQAEYDVEFRVVHPDGSIHFIKAYGVLVRDDQDVIQRMIGINFDITDRKQAEIKLQQQAEQEHLLSAITWRMRSSLNMQEILKATINELHQVLASDRVFVYRFFADGTGAAIAEAVSPEFLSVLNVTFPEEIFLADSDDLYAKGKMSILNDREDPNQLRSPTVVEFLTRIQVRARLIVPIIQNQTIQDQTLWGLLIAHQCDRPRSWQEWEINLMKQVANQLAIAIQQANLFEQLQQQLLERQQAETKLTETNQQLAISNEELARATRLKDEFLANMSHELRTPLNAILGMTEGLQEEVFGSVNEQQIKALKTVERSGSHLLELINDILDVAKIESGQIELEYTSIEVAHLCQSSMAFIKQQALKKRIQLDIRLQNNLPNLLVDERRMRQVLINLLNNAVKFTPEGGRITLEVKQIPPLVVPGDSALQNYLRIAIIDTGIGISAENIQKLFQPFIQIDSALNRQYAGTGLGLALVKRIVELHGGRVGLTSELEVGSCFSIELPSVPSPYFLAPITTYTDDGLNITTVTTSTSDKQSPLILLVEDNEANISTFSSYLGAKGYRIVVAKNGQEAIDLAKAQQPELILMDIQMPGMDGLEAMRQIRLDPTFVDIPIIALTALAMTGDRERCLAAGANDYLTKPVKLKQLANTIEQFLLTK